MSQPILKVQRWGGAFQVEIISDPSVKQTLFGWMSAHQMGPQSNWRFANVMDSRKLGVLKQATLYSAKRPGPARSGFLCFYNPLKVAIYVEEADRKKENQEPRIAILRFRHSPDIYNSGGAIFAATLAVSDSTLWIEDVLVLAGQNIWSNTQFSKRWEILKNWFDNSWSEDISLQRGLMIKPRNIEPLVNFHAEAGDVWEFIPEDAGQRRIIWKDRQIKKVQLSNYPQKPKTDIKKSQPQSQPQSQKQPLQEQTIKQPKKQVGILDTYFPSLPCGDSLVANAKKGDSGPDVYTLFSVDGVNLGIAVIRKMTLSLAMRTHCQDSTRVRVEWNSSFDRWEILDVNVSQGACNASSFIH